MILFATHSPVSGLSRPRAAIVLAIILLAVVSTGVAQEGPAKKVPGAKEVQDELREWVLTRQLISREQSAWQEQKETWRNLNQIRREEIEQLGEFTSSAKTRVDELRTKQTELEKERAALRTWRGEASKEVEQLEKSLVPLLPLFPTPLRQTLREPLERLDAVPGDSDGSERSLQDRARDIILILQAYREFQGTITIDREVISLGGKEREVEILYLGMSRAWFVDLRDEISGTGIPSPEGWTWTEDPSLASTVRRAIAMRRNEAPPQFLEIPLQLGTEDAP